MSRQDVRHNITQRKIVACFHPRSFFTDYIEIWMAPINVNPEGGGDLAESPNYDRSGFSMYLKGK